MTVLRCRAGWFVLVAWFVTAVLAFSLLSDSASAEDEPDESKRDDSARVVQRPDRVSAMSTAQAQKSRVEDLSARTDSSSLFAEEDGSWTVETYSGPIRTQDENDKWVDLDTDLTKADGAYAPVASSVGLEFSDGGDSSLVVLPAARDS